MGTVSPVNSYREQRTRRIVVVSAAMRQLFESADRAASCDAKVLITGESGVGKDTIAQHIHENSRRKTAEYVAINCAGLTESLLESELWSCEG